MYNFGSPVFLNVFIDLWEYLRDKFFSVNIGEYENFSLGQGQMISIRAIIVGICVGIVIAAIASAFDRQKYGGFIRKILSEECLSKEKAQTLSELGYNKSPAIRSDLKSGHILKKYVRCVEEEDFYAQDVTDGNDSTKVFIKYKHDFEHEHYYISEDDKYAADVKFEKEGSGLKSVILVIVIAVVICSFVCWILPDMLQLVDNFIGMMSGAD